MKNLTNLAIAAVLAVTPAFASDLTTHPNYPTLVGEYVGGYFRPDGVEGPEVPNLEPIYQYIGENGPEDFLVEDIVDPVIVWMTTDMINEFAGEGFGDAVAIYEEGYMYLNENIDFANPDDYSILLHELVHHVQWASGYNEREHYQVCPFHLEKDAYAIQVEWLEENGGTEEWIYAMEISGFAAGGLICYPDRPFG